MPAIKKRQPGEQIPNLNNATMGDFWSWAYSDVLSNVSRGVYAEFIVGTCLESLSGVRYDWDDFDLTYRDVKIEVKSAAYVQTWEQTRESNIVFQIPRKKLTRLREADIYIFCLFAERNPSSANVLDPTQWKFYVVAKRDLPEQDSISINPLDQLCLRLGLEQPVEYMNLKFTVDGLIDSELV